MCALVQRLGLVTWRLAMVLMVSWTVVVWTGVVNEVVVENRGLRLFMMPKFVGKCRRSIWASVATTFR
jgi:hypothetical protein